MEFEWDESNERHIGWHGVQPYEAEDAFFEPASEPEVQAVDGEERYRFDGYTEAGRLLTVIYTIRLDRILVVTAFTP